LTQEGQRTDKIIQEMKTSAMEEGKELVKKGECRSQDSNIEPDP